MNKVVHFEIPADDLDRAKKFYNETFGWELQDIPGGQPYTIVHTVAVDENQMPKESGAINGGLLPRAQSEVVKSPSLTIDVPSIDDYVKKVEAAGGKVVKAKVPVMDMGFVAYFQDPEGNVMGLWETVKK